MFDLLGNVGLAAETADANAGGSMWSTFAVFGALILFMYFIMIRPQQKAEKKKRAMLGALKKDDNVVTIGGIYGTVTDVDEEEDIVTIAVGPDKVRFMVKKSAIGSVEPVEAPDDDDDDDDDDEKAPQIESSGEAEKK